MHIRFIVFFLSLLLLQACYTSKSNSIVVEIYQTENTFNVYKNLYDCDSIHRSSFHVIKFDSSSLESIINASSFQSFPTLMGRLIDVIQRGKEGGFVLSSEAMIGKAKVSDTASMNAMLSGINCKTNLATGYKYTWIAIPDDTEFVYLAGLKKESPIVTLKAKDIDSLTLTPASTFPGIIDEIIKGKKETLAYSLNVVLNQSAAQLLKTELSKDTLAGYFMIISSGKYKDVISFKNSITLTKNILSNLHTIDKDELDDFRKKVDFDIYLIK